MKYAFLILGVIIVTVAVNPNIFQNLNEFGMPTISRIEKEKCDGLAKRLIGMELQNIFGAKSEVVDIREIKEVSRTKQKLVCSGIILTTTGLSIQRPYFLEINNDKYFYGIGEI